MKNKDLKTTVSVLLVLLFVNNLYYFIKSFFQVGILALNYRSIISYLPMFIGITGVIIFITSQYKKSSLLRIYFCYVIALSPITCWYYFKLFFITTEMRPGSFTQIDVFTYIYFIIFLIHITTVIVALNLLTKERQVKLAFTNISGESIAEFNPTIIGIRFANRLIDLLIILLLVYNFIAFNTDYFTSEISRQFTNPITLTLLELVALIYYYLFMEVIFKTTAGKCATNTIIVNSNAETASIAQLIGRTFCRLIPFEPFSFFANNGRGWHDSITNTYVVDSILKEEKMYKI